MSPFLTDEVSPELSPELSPSPSPELSPSPSQGKTYSPDECQYIHSFKNESSKLRHTQHTAFSDYKHQPEWAVIEEK